MTGVNDASQRNGPPSFRRGIFERMRSAFGKLSLRTIASATASCRTKNVAAVPDVNNGDVS